ncbi:epoxyqueuosine reductase [Pectinatus haikarae]|uniref:epoxyqueuosine reductase n=1 Tax=Pectinatus haikarae TaxID=349096 RepID=UPI0018C5D4AE
MSLTEEIKEFALDLGYSRVGITTAESFSRHIEEVKSRGVMYDFFVKNPGNPLNGSEVKQLRPSAKSIISMAWDYSQKSFPRSLIGKIGRIYQARCYNVPPDRINGMRYQLMVNFLKQRGCQIGHGIFIPERWAAARAGITTFGRNNFAYVEGIGSFIVLSSIVIDEELEYDEPTMEIGCPKGCTACMKACPTQAIYEPNKLNPRRCIAFNTLFAQDGNSEFITSHIPADIRDKMGTNVYGCDVCQEVCPRNQARLKAKLLEDEFLIKKSQDFSLAKMLNMTDEYMIKMRPLMYSYIKEKKYFQRNAAIAIGNLGNRDYLSDLEIAMNDPEALVREYAAWAIGKIGGRLAKQVLENKYAQETADSVKKEIKTTLFEA